MAIVFASLLKYIDYDWDSECWNWNRYRLKDGYGRVTYKNKQYLTHRLSMYLFGSITWEQLHAVNVVMHICDNPPCISPYHLVLSTQAENIADRKRKKRTAKHLENRDAYGRFTNKKLTVASAT